MTDYKCVWCAPDGKIKVDGKYYPLAFFAAHDPQARQNHSGQSIHRLAERGGLSVLEAYYILSGQKFRFGDTHRDDFYCQNYVDSMYRQWLGRTPDQVREAAKRLKENLTLKVKPAAEYDLTTCIADVVMVTMFIEGLDK